MAKKKPFLQGYTITLRIDGTDEEIKVAIPGGASNFGEVQERVKDLMIDLGHPEAEIFGIALGNEMTSLAPAHIYVLPDPEPCAEH